MASGEVCGPGCPTHNGDGPGTEDAYSPGGDPLCPSWGSDAPQGHFGGSGWIPAIYQLRSLMAMHSIYLGLIITAPSADKVATGNFAQEGRRWRRGMHRARGRHRHPIWRGISAMGRPTRPRATSRGCPSL